MIINKNNLENILQDLGLSDKEARIYRLLIEVGKIPAGELIKKSQLKRGITYNILEKLKKKGLITSFVNNKKAYFQANSPYLLLELAKTKKQEMENAEKSLNNLLPSIYSMYKMSIGKPTVRFFEGEEGIRRVFDDIYKPKKEPVYGCVDLEKADAAFPSYIQKQLIPKRVKNKVQAYSIIADSKEARIIVKENAKQLRKTLLLDKEKFPLPAEIDVYEDKIAMMTFARGEFVGLIVENGDLAQSLKSIFKYAFSKKK
jgi:HTH-type transcriptional regulator, sugar sensing transcriptional regulator